MPSLRILDPVAIGLGLRSRRPAAFDIVKGDVCLLAELGMAAFSSGGGVGVFCAVVSCRELVGLDLRLAVCLLGLAKRVPPCVGKSD